MKHANINDIPTYMRSYAPEWGDRILELHPPLYTVDDPPSPMIGKLLRKPYPAHTLAIMGLVRRWQQARAGAVIAECGTGKTLISLGAVQTHAEDRPFTALAMVPPQLVEKWCREAILTLPRVRVFIVDGLRTPTNSNSHHGVNEVKLRNKRIVREGLRTSLSELRLRRTSPSARKRWDSLCPSPALFVVGRDRAKLGFFWRHAYQIARCGRYQGSVVNPDSGSPVCLWKEDERLLAMDFKKVKLSEMLGQAEETNHARRPLYSALWQADGKKIRRFAPVDFIGRYMDGFFDYAIHQSDSADKSAACRHYLISLLWYFGSCPITSVCPYDGATSTFTGHTTNKSGCIYGEYKHGSHTSWEKCFCAGE